MRVRVLVIKGVSQYGGTRLFCDEAADAFRRAGHAVEVLDLEGRADAREVIFGHAQGCETDLIFTISILGEYRSPDGRTLSQLYRAPHVLWHVDYMIGQAGRVGGTDPQTALLTIDRSHIEAVRAAYGPNRFPRLGFMPHAGVGAPAPDDADAAAFAANRPIPLLWSASHQKPHEWTKVPERLLRPLREARDLALSVHWIAPHEALRRTLRTHGIDVDDPAHRGHLHYAGFVHDAVRKARRLEFLKAIAKTRVPIHICGAGWEPHLYRFKDVTYHGSVPMTEMVELMRRSRIVLNTNVNFGEGSHERPFSASLAGAATFSDHSGFYEEAFAPGEIEHFQWPELSDAMSRLKILADDPARCFDMARAAKARTISGHTWEHRVSQILEAASGATPS